MSWSVLLRMLVVGLTMALIGCAVGWMAGEAFGWVAIIPVTVLMAAAGWAAGRAAAPWVLGGRP